MMALERVSRRVQMTCKKFRCIDRGEVEYVDGVRKVKTSFHPIEWMDGRWDRERKTAVSGPGRLHVLVWQHMAWQGRQREKKIASLQRREEYFECGTDIVNVAS